MPMVPIKICFKFTYLYDSIAPDVCCCLSIVDFSPDLRHEKYATSLNGVLERADEVCDKF